MGCDGGAAERAYTPQHRVLEQHPLQPPLRPPRDAPRGGRLPPRHARHRRRQEGGGTGPPQSATPTPADVLCQILSDRIAGDQSDDESRSSSTQVLEPTQENNPFLFSQLSGGFRFLACQSFCSNFVVSRELGAKVPTDPIRCALPASPSRPSARPPSGPSWGWRPSSASAHSKWATLPPPSLNPPILNPSFLRSRRSSRNHI